MSRGMKKLSSRVHNAAEITLLAVSADRNDVRSLVEMLDGDECKVEAAASCKEAVSAIRRNTPAVVACEGELPDGSWKDLVTQVHDLDSPPPVVVMSRHADERFWAEVLNLGGYDVLAKPLERLEVSRVVRAASRYGRIAAGAA